MSTPADVVVVGSANLDLVIEVSRLPRTGETILGDAVGRFAGGKGLNQALASARTGGRTRFCACVGDDPAGDFLQDLLIAGGVAGAMLRTDTAPTGTAHVFTLHDSDNSIVVASGANGTLSAEDVTSAVSGARVVLAQLEVPLPSVAAGLSAARAAGALTLLNAAPAHPDALALLTDVDVLIVNETESDELGGIERLQAAGAAAVVRTLGGDGVEVHRAGRPPVFVEAFRVDVVDTTGAGDAFCGALAAALASGAVLEEAVVRGAAAGAIVAGSLGANTGALTPDAVDALMSAGQPW
ncbi:ribokinase [Agromyces neolithicus]|uniref:Ribokinase n=1 Tax=Agromyces neolithicus TaxID=269420 RepID=A0ABN2M1H7_9MICO